MTLVSGFVVFQMIWWIVLFTVLPVGIRTDPDKAQAGFANSAPIQLNLRKKLLITTLISIVLWSVVFIVMYYELISIHPEIRI
jgi:predicted secreted protein